MYQNDDDDNGDDDDDDGDDDNDNDDESDNEGEDNDNDDDDDACYLSLNSNEEVPCDFEDNDNDGAVVRQVVSRDPDESVNRPTKCFDAREVGVVQLGTGSYGSAAPAAAAVPVPDGCVPTVEQRPPLADAGRAADFLAESARAVGGAAGGSALPAGASLQ